VLSGGEQFAPLSKVTSFLRHRRHDHIDDPAVAVDRDDEPVCRVHFNGEQEARAFAQAFAGQVLNPKLMQGTRYYRKQA
jgi:hypothetical protein